MATAAGKTSLLPMNAVQPQQGKMLSREARFDKSAQPALRSTGSPTETLTRRHPPLARYPPSPKPYIPHTTFRRHPARAFARTRNRLTTPPNVASAVAQIIAARAPPSP